MILYKRLNYFKISLVVILILLLLAAASCKSSSSGKEEPLADYGTGAVNGGKDNEFAGEPDLDIVSNLKVPGQAIDAYISGDYAYLTSDLGILYVINISDRHNPVIEGKCRDTESSNIVIVKGDYAYVSYTNIVYENNAFYTKCGFYIVDVSDKKNPELTGNYDTGENNKKSAYGLFVEGNYAYIETADEEEQENVSCLEIVDISDKRNPEIVTKYEIDGMATGIWVKGNLALMNVNFYSYDEDNSEGGSKLIVVDLKDKNNPGIIDYCSINYISSSVYSIDDFAFITSWQLDIDSEDYTDSKLEVTRMTLN